MESIGVRDANPGNCPRINRPAVSRRAFLLLLGAIPAFAQDPPHAPPEKPTTIPLTEKNGLFYVDVKISGNPARLLVDTGASITLLNHKFAGLAAGVAESPVRGVGASAKGRRVRVRLDIGPRPFMADAVIGDFQVPDADGSLGSDVLSSCGMVTFDYGNQTMLLYRTGTNATH